MNDVTITAWAAIIIAVTGLVIAINSTLNILWKIFVEWKQLKEANSTRKAVLVATEENTEQVVALKQAVVAQNK